MVEALVLVAILSMCLVLKPENLLLFLLVLLPIHFFLKSAIEVLYNSSALFSTWKEAAVLILLAKVLYQNKQDVPADIRIILAIFLAVVIFYYSVAYDHTANLAQLRDHIFPILLMIAVSKMKLTQTFMNRFLNGIMTIGLISFIGGFLQSFVFNVEISTLKHTIDFIDETGYIQYSTNSARIMGIERMSGLFAAPNDLGIFSAFVLLMVIGSWLFRILKVNSKMHGFFILIILGLAMGCLILSFSRAGWGISVFGLLIMFAKSDRKVSVKQVFITTFTAIITIIIFVLTFPELGDVFLNSLTFKEASASDRGNDFMKGMEKAFLEPWGHGLGTTDIRSTQFLEFTVESAFWNISYEIGLFGLCFLILIHLRIISYLNKSYNRVKIGFVAMAMSISLVALLASFITINTYGMPFIYFWWMIIGVGISFSQSVVSETAARPLTTSLMKPSTL